MNKSKKIKLYMDYAASVDPNPSSIHQEGVEAKGKLESARRVVADVLGARPSEIIFTSGGTESNNLAIQGTVLAYLPDRQGKGLPHIITTNIEHPSVLETFKLLKARKLAQISIVEVEQSGIIDPKKIKKEIKPNTILVSVMYANNEIGTIQPIREIAKQIRHYRKGKAGRKEDGYFFAKKFLVSAPSRSQASSQPAFPLLHTDAVQAANYLDLNVEKLGVDLLSISGSKIDGAGRVGMLYKRKSARLSPLSGGGDQEMGLRPGTENVPEIVKFSKALESAQNTKDKEAKRLTALRDYFFKELRKIPSLISNGDLKNRLPNNINITIPGIPSDLLVIELSERGIMCSAKSACKSGDGKVSHVIKAINKNIKEEDGSIRFSLGRETSKADINYTIKSLSQILQKLSRWYN